MDKNIVKVYFTVKLAGSLKICLSQSEELYKIIDQSPLSLLRLVYGLVSVFKSSLIFQ